MDKNYYYVLYRKWTYVVLFFLLLTPSLRSSFFIAIRLEEIAILFLLLIFLWLLSRGRKVIICAGLQQKLLVLSVLIVPISILSGHILGYDTSIGDFNQLIRWFKYIFISAIAFSFISLSDNPQKDRINLLEYISKLSILLCVVSFQQYFNLFGLNKLYVPYVAPTQFRTLSGSYPTPRPVGLIGNPNELGFVFVIVTMICLYLLLNQKKSFRTIVIMFINIVMLTITMSRSSLMALLVGALVIIILSIFSNGYTLRVRPSKTIFSLVLYLCIAAMLVLTFTDIEGKVLWRFSALSDISSDNSWSARISNWSENIELFKSSPLLGVGPLRRAQFQHSADNEWLLFLRSYGVIGTIFMVCTFLIPALRSNKKTRILNLGIIIAMAIYMIPASVFHSLTLMPLVLIILSNGSLILGNESLTNPYTEEIK